MLVSLINDAVQLVIQTQTNEGSGDTIVFRFDHGEHQQAG